MEKVAGRPEWHALHEQFHNQLYALSGLPRLSQFVAVLRGQMRPYAQLYLNDAAHMRETHAEHFEIVAAARAGSVARLNKLVKEHLKRPARIALAALGEKVFPEFAPGASD
jgi:DNA-binding GntR family transcriptional regulator